MINIVVYGKPRSFESHEYAFDDENIISGDNSFPEPIIKPKNYKELVLHYFANNDYAGIDCYIRAKGFESERDGIVFGVALKSNHDFSVTKVIKALLLPYLTDFASELLDGDERFVCPSILNALNGTEWGNEEISTIRESVEQSLITLPNKDKKLCLLYAPILDYDQIHLIESQLKEYSEVYISSNLDVFKDSLNGVVLRLTGNVIHTIKDGAIVAIQDPAIEGSPLSTSTSNKKHYTFGGPHSGEEGLGVDPPSLSDKPKGEHDGRNDSMISEGGNDDDGGKTGMGTIAVIATICIIILIAVILFVKHANNHSDNTGGASSQSDSVSIGVSGGTTGAGSNTDELKLSEKDNITVQFNKHENPIKQFLQLKLTWDSSLSLVTDDFSLDVNHHEIVEITQDKKLKVKNSPTHETIVTVKAMYQGRICGSQDYIIAKKQPDVAPKTLSATGHNDYSGAYIQFSRGNNRSVFNREEHVKLSALDKDGKLITGGEWDLVGLSNSGSTKDNPITVWGTSPKTYSVRYKTNNKVLATTPFTVGL